MTSPDRPTAGVLEGVDDDVLLVAFAAGDRGAAVEFVRRFEHRVLATALAISRDRLVAEDIAQASFERAWRSAGTYRAERGAVSTWLLAITRNIAIDLRRRRVADPVDPSDLEGHLPPSESALGWQLEINEEADRARVRVHALPEPFRRTFLLATLGGMRLAEIAELDGVPLSTVKSRWRAGVRRVRLVWPDWEPA